MHIEGAVAVVTGGGSGIGRALAVALAEAGARVVVGDVDVAGAEATAGMIGASAVARRADAADADDIGALLALAESRFGSVDIFVANAGIAGAPGLGECEADWDRVLDVNVRAHVRAAQALVPRWLERGAGHFVAVASAAGLLTQVGAAGYSVSKHAAVGFAEWLAITYGDRGIGVSCVCPMGVDTPLLAGMVESDDAVVKLAASAVTTAGEVVAPEAVAEATIDAVRHGRFLVLPHPAVLEMLRGKGADYDGWIAGMRRYRGRLVADG
jgi:NAD(P)-dependent dehydrogenase (short-subunit alcohol dehydrogenase family)